MVGEQQPRQFLGRVRTAVEAESQSRLHRLAPVFHQSKGIYPKFVGALAGEDVARAGADPSV
jgi:hypothetical protein